MSAILHAGAFVLAILISIALIRAAFAVPAWWAALTVSALMNIPVALLAWAGAPRWVIPLPLVAILGVLAFMLSAVAVEQHRRLQHLCRERDNARQTLRRPESVEASASAAAGTPAPAGWWDAPKITAPVTEDDSIDTVINRSDLVGGQHGRNRSADQDSQEFQELIRRNFSI
ncbi:hypothetical protein RBB84_19400 [Rhodococcus sp. D-6]|uniref:Uncharacterized protein n=2 Tax=Rhodococcus TaxID=1827 RepID=A0A7M2XXB7_9NOCA|nr:hypothetical protein [Rhodococcus pyridinivorans]QOW01954.1 hypothetical protein INP59_26640 [Rhodococcus pyridinivorans]